MSSNLAVVPAVPNAITPDVNDLLALVAKLTTQLEQAQKAAMSGKREVSFKLAEKGGISVYGLQKFPVTLYRESWLKLFDAKDNLMGFIEANKEALDKTYNEHMASKK